MPATEGRRGFKFWLVGVLGAAFLRLLRRTWRVASDPPDFVAARRAAHSDGPGTVYVTLHYQLLMSAALQSGKGVHVLVSQHADGEYIARALARLGSPTIRGSSTRGGIKALMEACGVLRRGHDLAFQADGPRGPRLVLKPGPVLAAMRSGAEIVCVAYGWDRARRLRSWDRFALVWPFNRVTVLWSDPIRIPRRLDEDGLEHWRKPVEDVLIDLAHRAGERHGLPVETPDVDPLEQER